MANFISSISSFLGFGMPQKEFSNYSKLKGENNIDSDSPLTFSANSPADYSSVSKKRLESAISRIQTWLLNEQHEDGYWIAELEANCTITSEYIFFNRFLSISNPEKEKKAAERLIKTQQEDGGWNLYYGGPGDLSATVEAYFALKIAGFDIDEPVMKKSRAFILDKGGVEKSRVFTRQFMALFGLYEWEKLPSMPVEMMFLPNWFYFNIYEFSSWSRSVIVPLLIIFAKKPISPLDDSFNLDELYVSKGHSNIDKERASKDYWKALFIYLDKYFLKVLDKYPITFLRNRAIRKAENWTLNHQDELGNWGGIIPAMMNSIIALYCLDYKMDDETIKKGITAIESFVIEDKSSLALQSCISPIWDTAITCNALRKSGLPDDHPKLIKAANWLIDKQILKEGDWKVKNKKGNPGGWAFEFENDHYPDNDDTTEVLMALRNISTPDANKKKESFDRGLQWLLSMQSANGGWAAFDVDNNKQILNKIPFADLDSLLDPPSSDITGRVLWLLGNLGYRTDNEQVKRALNFLKKNQEKTGSWYGRWGVNYIYGTFLALNGLKAIDEDMNQGYIQKAVNWLKIHQNNDGGWGESCMSYEDNKFEGVGNSSVSQTAWALIGLIAADESSSSFVHKGIKFLLDRQNNDGSWDENEFTGTGFPKHFYIRYHMYRNYFPLLVLAEYNAQTRTGN